MVQKVRMLLPAIALAAAGFAPAAAQDAPPPAVAALDHVAIWVADQQKSVDFYQALFGLREIASPFPPGGPRWLAFASGLELHIQPGRTDPVAAPRRVHMAIAVPSLDPVIAYLKAHGRDWYDIAGTVGAISRGRNDGVLQIFIQDPDGYWIEVNDVAAR